MNNDISPVGKNRFFKGLAIALALVVAFWITITIIGIIVFMVML